MTTLQSTGKSFSQLVLEENERVKAHPHLGGHYGITHVDAGALDFLINNFGISSLVDIGCGPGGMVKLALQKGLDALGIDGDDTIAHEFNFIHHDYAKSPLILPKEYDCGWCVEFVEHVNHEFIPNFMASFQQCKMIVLTHALPKQAGHHHVNCMPFEYWLGIMQCYGFEPLYAMTDALRAASTMQDIFMKQSGYVFIRRDILLANGQEITRTGLALI